MHARHIVSVGVASLVLALSSHAQALQAAPPDLDKLQAQLHAMQSTIADLQKQMIELRQSPLTSTVAPADTTALSSRIAVLEEKSKDTAKALDIAKQFEFHGYVLVHWNDQGYTPVGGSGSSRTYYAIGTRPVYMFTEHLGAALEVGYDYATDNRSTARKDNPSLGKITFAPLVRPGSGFFTRPEIRLYATYYFWNDFPAGSQINGTGVGDKSTWNFGIQAEAWW